MVLVDDQCRRTVVVVASLTPVISVRSSTKVGSYQKQSTLRKLRPKNTDCKSTGQDLKIVRAPSSVSAPASRVHYLCIFQILHDLEPHRATRYQQLWSPISPMPRVEEAALHLPRRPKTRQLELTGCQGKLSLGDIGPTVPGGWRPMEGPSTAAGLSLQPLPDSETM